MEQLVFSTNIQASASHVWDVLWDDTTYRQWTAAFHAGSYAVSDWKEGDKIHFLTSSGRGMYGVIEKKTENVFISFKHIGELKDFEEQPLDEATMKWSGAHENYTLTEMNGHTELSVSFDAGNDFADFFKDVFPKALDIIKSIAEGRIKPAITIETVVHAPIEKVWDSWTQPEHVMKWNQASEDWHTTKATNDLTIGGKFLSRMEARDGSFGFDFEGEYVDLKTHELISYKLPDDRHVKAIFTTTEEGVHIAETFDVEGQNPRSMQRMGWQAILDNFKKYTETL